MELRQGEAIKLPGGTKITPVIRGGPAMPVAPKDDKPNFQPLGDKVFALKIQGNSKTDGGIEIPDTANKRAVRARVLAVGPGKFDPTSGQWIPVHPVDGSHPLITAKKLIPGIAVGDVIWVPNWGGQVVMIRGVEYLTLNPDEILGLESRG